MADAMIKRHPFVFSWLAALLILSIRSWGNLQNPSMEVEDGTYMLAIFFDDHSLGNVARIYNEYASLLPNLIAWALAYLPLTWQPRSYALAALLICATAHSMFSRHEFRWIIENDRTRQAVCLLMSAFAFGGAPTVTSLTCSQWNILFILFLFLLQSPDFVRRNRVLRSAAVGLCIFSHPLSVLCVLLCFLRCSLGRLEVKLSILFIAFIAAYHVFFVEAGVVNGLAPSMVALKFFIANAAFVGKVMLEPFVGAHYMAALLKNWSVITAFAVVSMVILLFSFFLLIKSRRIKNQTSNLMLFIFYISFAMVFISILTRMTGWGWSDHIQNPYMQRYSYASRLLVLMVCSYAISRFCLQREWWQGKSRVLFSVVLIIAVMCSYRDRFLYLTNTAASGTLMTFLQSTQDEIDGGNIKCVMKNDCERILPRMDNPHWAIRLNLANKVPAG